MMALNLDSSDSLGPVLASALGDALSDESQGGLLAPDAPSACGRVPAAPTAVKTGAALFAIAVFKYAARSLGSGTFLFAATLSSIDTVSARLRSELAAMASINGSPVVLSGMDGI